MVIGRTNEHSYCRGSGVAQALEGARNHAGFGEIKGVERCIGKAKAIAGRDAGIIILGPLVEAARHALLYSVYKQLGKKSIGKAWDMARGGMISEVEVQLNVAKESARKAGLPFKRFISRREYFRLVRKAFDSGLYVMRRAAGEGDVDFMLGEKSAMRRVARSLKWSIRIFLSRKEERRMERTACRRWTRLQRREWYESYRQIPSNEVDEAAGTLLRCADILGSSPKKLLGEELSEDIMSRHGMRVVKRMADRVFKEMKRRVFGRE